MNGAHWNEALRFYGTAYEVSYILLHADAVDDITRVKQYLRTALEYGFALRKSLFFIKKLHYEIFVGLD